VEAIAAANGLTYPYLIYVGQELVIPEAGEATPIAGQVYVVQYGDTLFSIAQAYGTSVEALAEANGLTSPYIIYIGQQLVIP
jgi:putative chitinase